MKDCYTDMLMNQINNWGLDKIYEMEDDIWALDDKVSEIVSYLKNIHFSMPLGIALRRYICEAYSSGFDALSRRYSFNLPGKVVFTKDHTSEGYDIKTDDIAEYVEIFCYINEKYNTDAHGRLAIDISKNEIRRHLRSVSECTRKKMFELSFALHMNSEYTSKFLTDVLAEQTYNFREPMEIIAFFCQSKEEYNSYCKYSQLCSLYELRSATADGVKERREGFTSYAKTAMERDIASEEMLMDFLLANKANFAGFSETAYNAFVRLYIRASALLKASGASFDLSNSTVEEHVSLMESGIRDKILINPEQLAKEMLSCIPRAETKRFKDGKWIYSNDYINIYNGEGGQSSKKVKTTELPKRITMNLPVSDRLWDLIRRKIAVSRKDIVFMEFYVFSLYLREKENYSSNDYFDFLYTCNDVLMRCGMSKLYPGNRFENLVMLSLLASNPFEMFENIIEYSFINEPRYDDNE